MFNSGDVEALGAALEQMKKGLAVIREYCSEECDGCPLYRHNVCGYYCELDLDADIDKGLLNDFVDYSAGVCEAKERKAFTEVTGIDAGWYDFNDDRTEVME